MPRIDRYILTRLLATFGIASLVLVLVYWVNRAVVLFDQLIRDGQSAWVFLEFTALALPSIVRIVLPLAAFVATLWAVHRLQADSEVTVLHAAGASPWRIARPVLTFGLLVGLLVSVISHLLAPAALNRLDARRAEIAETATARLLREGEFVSPLAGLTIYIREVTPDGVFRGVLVSDRREAAGGSGFSTITTAASAYLVRAERGPQLVMLDGQIQRLDESSGRLAVTGFGDLAYDLGPLLPDAGPRDRSPGQLSTRELLDPSPEVVEETGEGRADLIARGHLRVAEALLAPAAALVAAACLLAGRFSRLGAWPPTALAVGLAIGVKVVESAAGQAIRADPSAWPLAYLPGALGAAAAAALLWLAGRPWRAAGAAAEAA